MLMYRSSKMVKTNEKPFQKFISSIRFFLILGQIFGMIPFSHTENKFRSSNATITRTICTVCLMVTLTAYLLYINVAEDSSLPVQKTANLLCIFTGTTFIATIWINNLLKRDKLMEFLLKIFDFDRQIPSARAAKIYQKISKQSMKYFLFKHFFLSVYIIFQLFFLSVESLLTQILSNIYVCLVTTCGSIWCHQSVTMVLMLKMRFVTLNQQIKTLTKCLELPAVETNTDQKLFILSKICSLHHHLSKLVTLFNEIFGVNMLTMFAFNFIAITVALVFGSAAIQWGDTRWWVYTFIVVSCCCYGIDCFYSCSVCHSTVEQVNMNLKKNVIAAVCRPV
jgi:hypothetical protein